MSDYQTLIIRNRDKNNNKFRPSDWADRMASVAANFEGGRLQYNSKVLPCKRCDDIICLRVDRSIKDEQPHVLQTVEEFMEMHELENFVAKCPEHAIAFHNHMETINSGSIPDQTDTAASAKIQSAA